MTTSVPGLARRSFLKSAALLTSGFSALSLAPFTVLAHTHAVTSDMPTIVGPVEGYSPQVGTLVSMMAWCRFTLVSSVKDMTTEQLDFLLDDKANTIGALLYHVAATDAFYHEHTFKGVKWDKWDKDVEKKFGVAMALGAPARKAIKGNSIGFYLGLLEETRTSTLAELKKRDDQWLMTVDEKWFWGPTNTYCKWFHVVEHESHHQGQINLIQSRVPGAKKG